MLSKPSRVQYIVYALQPINYNIYASLRSGKNIHNGKQFFQQCNLKLEDVSKLHRSQRVGLNE